ncbi:MAG: hypothetical protein XU11_C0026G0038 [Candidatus Dadabacteria bacterium CSP1-2]|nr:MAG: hypothetical protein XU11_C0026G0038 [Candidatus Dadabacteria bacterium CSP1-2]
MKWIMMFFFLCTASTLKAEIPQPSPVKVELLTDVANVKPGGAFILGVLFRIKPGWHIYWKNPGDSGLPTSVKFGLTDEFSVGQLRWPVPARFYRSGDIIDYGYAESVLLSAKVKAPAELSSGSTVPIRANISWLSCEKICIPGHANLELKLPVSEMAAPVNSELFAQWEEHLPSDSELARNPFAAKITGRVNAQGTPSTFTVLLDWKFPPVNVEWFPEVDGAFDIVNLLYKTEGKQTHITFTAMIFPGQGLSSNFLETLVAYTDAKGERKGVKLPIQLRGAINPKNK